MNMRNLFRILCVVLILYSCNKNELSVNNTMPVLFETESSMIKEIIPDVFVENGYLVLKDLQVRDSIANLLSEMTDEERVTWERSLGFESAQTHYAYYFEKYDNVTSEEECVQFAKDFASVLQITRDEEGLIDVDYPFNPQGYECILNKDGKVKVGLAMYVYKNDRRIVIYDATPTMIVKFQNARFSSMDGNVEVIYNTGVPMAKSNVVASDIVLASSGGFIKEGKKKYKWDLLYVCEKEKTSKYLHKVVSTVKLKQNAKKKYLGGWHEYSTTYHVAGNSFIRVNEMGNTTYVPFNKQDLSQNRSRGATFILFQTKTKNSFRDELAANHTKLSLDININHRPNYKGNWFNTKIGRTIGSSEDYNVDIIYMRYW